MVNPLIIAKGAQAVGVATKGAAAGAAKIAMTDKAAKAVGGAFKSIEETTKMGGFQQLENFANSVTSSGPAASAFQMLSAQFTSETMGSRITLMQSLMDLFASDSFQQVLKLTIALVNGIINGSAAIIDVFNILMAFLGTARSETDHPDDVGYGGGLGGADQLGLGQYDLEWWEAMGYDSLDAALEDM